MPTAPTERDNRLWLDDLRSTDRRREAAQSELRALLHRGLARALANRGVAADLAEDLAQEAMLKVLDSLDTFRGDSRFSTWAMAIAMRTAFTELRRARWRDQSLDEIVGGHPDDAFARLLSIPPDGEASLQRRQVMDAMAEVIRRELSPKQRTALLGELAEVPKSVLAERLAINTNALYKLGHDARRRLRQGLLNTGLTEHEIRATFTR